MYDHVVTPIEEDLRLGFEESLKDLWTLSLKDRDYSFQPPSKVDTSSTSHDRDRKSETGTPTGLEVHMNISAPQSLHEGTSYDLAGTETEEPMPNTAYISQASSNAAGFEAVSDSQPSYPRRDDDKSSTLPASKTCLLYTSPSPRDGLLSRMPSSA